MGYNHSHTACERKGLARCVRSLIYRMQCKLYDEADSAYLVSAAGVVKVVGVCKLQGELTLVLTGQN